MDLGSLSKVSGKEKSNLRPKSYPALRFDDRWFHKHVALEGSKAYLSIDQPVPLCKHIRCGQLHKLLYRNIMIRNFRFYLIQ